ncbi:hypothetical protein NPA31_011695 [Aurantimonas sp. MSK8Z-1]|uniref:hypothetical protein n=1 Tax=Mangrovibrevibacter kandeliae TaxID=2968473 RepID=UPI0021192C3E|nr:hypothetical protein [Aurantimonas sp. MSK8Z-1]MCW4115626.1 hypothetical protein [Aurantimonas sp. MSK8Z-1]
MFEAKRFLTEEIGGPQNVLSLFGLYVGRIPTYEAVQKWYARNSISGDWLAVLLCILELDRGRPVELAGYMKE